MEHSAKALFSDGKVPTGEEVIIDAVQQTCGQRTRVADSLGIIEPMLLYKLRKYSLKVV